MGKTIKSLRRNPDAPLWRDVLKSIKAKPKLAFYFAKPVDHVALNIPLYPTIVKTPMDLQTIERKLAANEYAELADFATDVRLVFSNAMLFNKNEQHQVHIAARKLSTFFELKYEELKRGHQREKRDAPGRRDRPPPRPHGAFASQPRAAFLAPATTRDLQRAVVSLRRRAIRARTTPTTSRCCRSSRSRRPTGRTGAACRWPRAGRGCWWRRS